MGKTGHVLYFNFISLHSTYDFVGKMSGNPERDTNAKNDDEEEDLELPMFELSSISSATNNFSTDNKLGEGGFGSVYKVMKF